MGSEMQNINDWLLTTIREDEKKGVMSGWIEEKRFLILPQMAQTIAHILQGGSVIILTDNMRKWFGEYIIHHINQPHKGRPFFPIMQITHLQDMISSNTQENTKSPKFIYNMLDMISSNYQFWYIGKKSIGSNFAKEHGRGWYLIFDENEILKSTDEYLDYKLLILFKVFERALLAAMFNQISLDI